MKESDDKYSNRIADAEQLTKEVQAIYTEIKVFEDAYKKQIAPLKQKIAQLEESFMDKWLVVQREDLLVKEWLLRRMESDLRFLTDINNVYFNI